MRLPLAFGVIAGLLTATIVGMILLANWTNDGSYPRTNPWPAFLIGSAITAGLIVGHFQIQF